MVIFFRKIHLLMWILKGTIKINVTFWMLNNSDNQIIYLGDYLEIIFTFCTDSIFKQFIKHSRLLSLS